MPRRGGNRRRPNSRRRGGFGGGLGGGINAAGSNDSGVMVTRVPFTVLKTVALSAAPLSVTVGLSPVDAVLGASRLGGLSPFWDSFRFTSLKCDVMPNNGSNAALLAGAYTDDVFTTTAPANVQDLLQLACKVYQTPTETVPVRLWVPRRYLLKNGLKWWKVRGSTDSFEGQQGSMQFLSTGNTTGTYNFIFSGVCELKDPVNNVDLVPRGVRDDDEKSAESEVWERLSRMEAAAADLRKRVAKV